MNLEILISKYIDGELSHEEDATLRRILKDDNLSREKFNSSVELHLEMNEDARTIEVPPELLSNTEDLLLMKILGSAPDVKILATERKQRSFYGYSLAASLLFALFLSALRLGDGSLTDFGIASVKQSIEIPDKKPTKINSNGTSVITVTNPQVAKIISNRTPAAIRKVNSLSPTTLSDLSNNNFEILKSTSFDKTDEINKQTNLNDLSSDDNSQESVSRINTSSAAKSAINMMNLVSHPGYIMSNTLNKNELFSLDNVSDFSFQEVKLTTIISQSFSLGGFKTSNGKPVMNYSQSISYSLNPDNQVGIEFGLMQFSTSYIQYIAIPGGSGNHSSTEVLQPTNGGDGTYLTIAVKGEGNNRLFWGTAFYERNFLRDASGFYLDGRVGIGSINEGFLGYMRFTAKYELFTGVMLTAGSESRLMFMDFPGYDRGAKSLFGLVYGVQFKF